MAALGQSPAAAGAPEIIHSERVNVGNLLGFLAWLGLLILAVGLLDRIARRGHWRPRTVPLAIQHLHRSGPQARDSSPRDADGYPVTAFPIIPRPRPRPTAVPNLLEAGDTFDNSSNRTTEMSQDVVEPSVPAVASISLLGPLTITGSREHGRRSFECLEAPRSQDR